MSFTLVSSFFYGYFKVKDLELLYKSIEKKMRYIQYVLDVNDNYRTHHEKNHTLILERIQILEHIILNSPLSNSPLNNSPLSNSPLNNSPLNNLQKKSSKNNNVTSNTDTTNIDYNNNIDIEGDTIILAPRDKSIVEIELDAELDYMDDFYNNPTQHNNVIVKRSSTSFLDLTKKMIFG
jgi:hypothetical protein